MAGSWKMCMDGHIQIRGAGITAGYYNNPSETLDSFDDGWLKTGDKGFFFEGHLYITGRVKDIIFVRGQNLYAHDLENLAAKSFGYPLWKGHCRRACSIRKKAKDQVILFLVGSPNQAICDTVPRSTEFLPGYLRNRDRCICPGQVEPGAQNQQREDPAVQAD